MTLAEKLELFKQFLENQDYEFLVYIKSISQDIDFDIQLLESIADMRKYFLELKNEYFLHKISSEPQEFKRFCMNSKQYINKKLVENISFSELILDLEKHYCIISR